MDEKAYSTTQHNTVQYSRVYIAVVVNDAEAGSWTGSLISYALGFNSCGTVILLDERTIKIKGERERNGPNKLSREGPCYGNKIR